MAYSGPVVVPAIVAAVVQEGHSLASAVGVVDPALVRLVALAVVALGCFDHSLEEHSCLPANYLAELAFGTSADFVVELEDTAAAAAAAAGHWLDGEDCFVG